MPDTSSNSTTIRRANLLLLLKSFIEDRISAGVPAKGIELLFAAQIQVHPTLLSQLKSSRPIGNKLSRQIEKHCSKDDGWLDQFHEPMQATPAESAFLAICRDKWLVQNAKGKRDLKRLVTSFGGTCPESTNP